MKRFLIVSAFLVVSNSFAADSGGLVAAAPKTPGAARKSLPVTQPPAWRTPSKKPEDLAAEVQRRAVMLAAGAGPKKSLDDLLEQEGDGGNGNDQS